MQSQGPAGCRNWISPPHPSSEEGIRYVKLDPMHGLMMDYPLTLTHILERSAKLFPGQEIASRLCDGSMHRYTYADYHKRVHRLGYVLQTLGIEPGDRVGTLCWN